MAGHQSLVLRTMALQGEKSTRKSTERVSEEACCNSAAGAATKWYLEMSVHDEFSCYSSLTQLHLFLPLCTSFSMMQLHFGAGIFTAASLAELG